jgi:type IV pilus assembly protein PilP
MIKTLFVFIVITSSITAEARLDDLFNEHTSIKDPFSLRDPFQEPRLRTEKSRKRKQRIGGVWDNIPTLDNGVTFDQLIIKGVLIGKDRRVMVTVGDKDVVYTLSEGEQLGSSGTEIKAILPGGIILVEKITNIYGEDEYIETVVPISK